MKQRVQSSKSKLRQRCQLVCVPLWQIPFPQTLVVLPIVQGVHSVSLFAQLFICQRIYLGKEEESGVQEEARFIAGRFLSAHLCKVRRNSSQPAPARARFNIKQGCNPFAISTHN